MKTLLEKEDIQKDLFDEKHITEVINPDNETRYALCKNEQEMRKVDNLTNDIVVKSNISEPDEEQTEILNLLNVKLV